MGPALPMRSCFFFIKDNKYLCIQNVGHIWAYIHADSQYFWKSFNRLDNTKHVKKIGLKNAKQIIKKTSWGTSKIWRLDPKVCADPSWLLVFKNGLKKCSSLKNVIVIWCLKLM